MNEALLTNVYFDGDTRDEEIVGHGEMFLAVNGYSTRRGSPSKHYGGIWSSHGVSCAMWSARGGVQSECAVIFCVDGN